MARTNSKNAASVGHAVATKAAHQPSRYVWLFLLVQMGVCVAGIYACFTMWSLKQERVVTKPYFVSGRDSRTGSATQSKGEVLQSRFGLTLIQNLACFALSTAFLALGQLWRLARYCFTCCARMDGKGRKSTPAVTTCATKSFGVLDVVQFLLMSLSSIFASSVGFEAMRLLPYPVVLTAKMSKKIPIILVGFVWYGTRYSARMLLSCAMITSGVLLFYFLSEDRTGAAREQLHPRDLLRLDPQHIGVYVQSLLANVSHTEIVGFMFLLASLIMDGFMHSTQDVLVQRRRWGGNKLMATSSGVSAILILCIMFYTEKYETHIIDAVREGRVRLATLGPSVHSVLSILPTANDLQRNPSVLRDFSLFTNFLLKYPEAMRDILAMSLYNAAGQLFIFRTIAIFGSMTVTTMTILRKLSSVVLSVFVNKHHTNELQWASLGLVTLGVCMEAKTSIDEAARTRCQNSVQTNDVAQNKKSTASPKLTTPQSTPIAQGVESSKKKGALAAPKEPTTPVPTARKNASKHSNGDGKSPKSTNGNSIVNKTPTKKTPKKTKSGK